MKQVWELTVEDLKEHPVWYFPMLEDEDCDEATVLPADSKIANDPNTQIIVISDFVDTSGNKYIGYMYFGDLEIELSQPCMYINDVPVTFWFGIVKPPKSELQKLSFPIEASSKSIYGLDSQKVKIINYGYYDDNFKKQLFDI